VKGNTRLRFDKDFFRINSTARKLSQLLGKTVTEKITYQLTVFFGSVPQCFKTSIPKAAFLLSLPGAVYQTENAAHSRITPPRASDFGLLLELKMTKLPKEINPLGALSTRRL